MKAKLDLFNYAAEADFKNAAGVDWFAKKVDLANLKSNLSDFKSKVDKLYIDKLISSCWYK